MARFSGVAATGPALARRRRKGLPVAETVCWIAQKLCFLVATRFWIAQKLCFLVATRLAENVWRNVQGKEVIKKKRIKLEFLPLILLDLLLSL